MSTQSDSIEGVPGLAAPAKRALVNAGYSSLGQLVSVSEVDLLRMHGMGKKAVASLRDAMDARGLSFAHVAND